jgi:biotin carboxyl carrier protein
MNGEPIVSPFLGTVEEVLINSTCRIYEWENLFKIRAVNGELNTVSMGLSGEIQSIEVKIGDNITPGMVLAVVKEDLIATGSD